MSLYDRNRMLHILHKNGTHREQVTVIMEDLEWSGIFGDPFEDEQDDWFLMEQQADIWFGEGKLTEKIEAIKSIKEKIGPQYGRDSLDYFIDVEARIRLKQEEYIKLGVVEPDPPEAIKRTHIVTRYGRSPLHEAIAMRDLKTVRKLIKAGKYLTERDNNGHTAMEMAFYEDYSEALKLFSLYRRKKKKR